MIVSADSRGMVKTLVSTGSDPGAVVTRLCAIVIGTGIVITVTLVGVNGEPGVGVAGGLEVDNDKV